MKTISTGLDGILDKEFKLLDHGFIRVVDYMGNDSSVVQSARVSYGDGTKTIHEDKGLINYLMRHQHSTPYEHCVIKFHIRCPIFVMRQWVRHRSSSYNEYSARYSIVPDLYYNPEPDNIGLQSSENMQGRGNLIGGEKSIGVCDKIESVSNVCYEIYQELLDEGIAREIARTILPVNFYTEFYWTVNLHNLMHFVKLRADDHAQYEIRVYALQILEILKLWVPLSYDAFVEYRLEAKTLSKTMMNVVKRMLNGEIVTQENSGLSKREWGEFNL